MEACTNPNILKVIYFFLLIIDIVKIIIPIALILLGIIDFSKSVIISDEKVQKKSINLFFKRLLYAILVFIVPWIVEVLMVTLGNLFGEENKVNFTDCIENANSKTIEKLENGTFGEMCYYCHVTDTYLWRTGIPSESCPGGEKWSQKNNITKENCK